MTRVFEAPRGTKFENWRALFCIVLAQGAGATVAQGIYVLLPFWKTSFSLSQASTGALVTALSLGQLVALIGLGRLIDDLGERRVLGFSLLALGAACVLTLAIPSGIEILFVTIFLWGFFYAAGQPSGAKAIVSWFPASGRGLAIGLHQAAVPLGATVAALVLPAIALEGGWTRSVAVMAAVSGAAGLFILVAYRNRDASQGRDKAALQKATMPRLEWRFKGLLLVGIAMTGVQFTFAAHGVLFIAEQYQLDFVQAAALFSLTQIVAIGARIILPGVIEHFWPRRLTRAVALINLAGIGSIAVAVQITAHAPSEIYVVLMLLVGVFAVGWYPVYLLALTELAPKDVAGRVFSLVTMLCMIARLAGPPAFGLVVDLYGYGPAWLALLAPAALCTIPMLWLRFKPLALDSA